VEVLGSINWWDWEAVASSVSSWVVAVHSGGGMKWLMDVTGVVHDESHGSGYGVDLSRGLIFVSHDGFVLVVGGIVVWLVDPVSDAVDGLDDGVVIDLEVWEVGDITTLIEEGGVNEMPSGLVWTTLIFNIISECDAFNKWMVAFFDSPFWVRSLKDREDVLYLSDGGLIKKLVGNSGDEEMSISPPGAGLTKKCECYDLSFHLKGILININ
jgi:hypothetical protein